MSDARSWLAPCCALALAGCARGLADQPRDAVRSSSPPARGLARREVEAAVTEMLQGMIEDITVLKAKYPELAEWNVKAPVNGGFMYHYRISYATDPPEVGAHGCNIGAWIRPEPNPPPLLWLPRYRFASLGILGHTWINAGEKGTPGFCAEVQSIFTRRMAAMEGLEWRTAFARESAAARREP